MELVPEHSKIVQRHCGLRNWTYMNRPFRYTTSPLDGQQYICGFVGLDNEIYDDALGII